MEEREMPVDDFAGIKQIYSGKLLKAEKDIKKITCILPSPMSYTLQTIFDKYKDGKHSASDIIKLSFINDYLNDEFNTGCWQDVDINIRISFTITSLLKILITFQDYQQLLNEKYIQSIMKSVDMGLLLGAPLLDENDENILANMGTNLMEYYNKHIYHSSNVTTFDTDKNSTDNSQAQKSLEMNENCHEILSIQKPELSYFYKTYFKPNIPVKLLDCIDHWPAKNNWQNLDYFIQVAGERTVPVEVGSHYADDNWTQKLMTIREFIMNHVCKEYDDELNRGYLAQHTLFDQLPRLREDILIPDYCALSDEDESHVEPEINAWFGPKGTVSPLHYDPKHNLLTQVIGSKEIILFSPNDSKYLYPYDDKLLFNTSQVNPISPNLNEYPEFTKATSWKCLLKPGEMLYIPPKWWHHVISIEKSFSVSFWWR